MAAPLHKPEIVCASAVMITQPMEELARRPEGVRKLVLLRQVCVALYMAYFTANNVDEVKCKTKLRKLEQERQAMYLADDNAQDSLQVEIDRLRGLLNIHEHIYTIQSVYNQVTCARNAYAEKCGFEQMPCLERLPPYELHEMIKLYGVCGRNSADDISGDVFMDMETAPIYSHLDDPKYFSRIQQEDCGNCEAGGRSGNHRRGRDPEDPEDSADSEVGSPTKRPRFTEH